ncbi:GNAT family N-acetyltransferase [Peredibacter starrii]|uniref:GNAT family N-acetyltransferase n=1 Tax=Peredibacter starrii TaxID=28202 RepID=A0AAX4HKX1_9BACT|nr:GNAT family N-acetyltransferase [Peredibacter starrii]WPU63815.1 GNAT family N-acetyltransferase [Peredibacter starrii]
MKPLFFSPEFSMNFVWRERFHLRAGSVRPHNKKQISEGLRNMSPESIRNRFLGSKREFSDQELKYLTSLDGWNHYAIGIEEQDGQKRGIAIVRMVRASHDIHEAEVAVTIIDDFQRKGLGSFLLNLIILAAMERDIHTLSFTFLPSNDGIVKIIHKVGVPYPGPHNSDYVQLFLDVKKYDVNEVKGRLAKTLPEILNFNFP